MEGKLLPQETWDKIEDISFDYMYRKHELSHWKNGYDRNPYCYEILGKTVVIDPYLKPDKFEVKNAWLSPNEQFMTIGIFHTGENQAYFALATWQKEAEIYLTFIYHSTFINEWQNFTTFFD